LIERVTRWIPDRPRSDRNAITSATGHRPPATEKVATPESTGPFNPVVTTHQS
jgi:hypothetical protein